MNKDRFEQIAQKYDGPSRIHLADTIAQEVNKIFENTSYQSLLDYGGGTGLVTLSIERHFDEITMMDAAPQMIEVFENKISELGKTHIHAYVGDILSDDTQINTTYDVIFLSLVLLHSGDYTALLTALRAKLNSAGLLVLVDFDKNENVYHPKVYNGFEQTDIQQLFTELGLTHVQSYTFYEGKNIFMNKDASLFIASGRS
ncbi:class I SAM-dependent DNA methyltransferase [Staphylococcus sp. NAM3COL9]|uniref:class I SAM-dependent DNA methyltransferase n=1 Tax=Staphylococcus sp. NAM3COL9 TaxID=1667172 RepID=UPI00070C7342|nr:methyltransferase domain-containing protein [Staphylococcus sp. NAM3COL9]KRG11181.1 methyltransferase [Staphylococcus sp. NAM3COL9]